MSSQTSLTTRRQFLHRSAWGFGSAFVLPSLLASCTDHIIPPTDPSNPVPPPLVGDEDDIDWNDDAKTLVVAALGDVPVVGDLLGPMLDILWPGTSVWDQIKDQVEALIDKKIDNGVYQQVSDDLGSLTDTPASGLAGAITLYLNAIKNGTTVEKNQQWGDTKTAFVTALPHFQSNGSAGDYRVLLLPLFVQFANMYLGLLRDAVIDGQSWGRTDADHQQDITDLQAAITGFTSYTTNTYNMGHDNLFKSVHEDDRMNEPFISVNKYVRQMTMTVLDFMDTWQYYNIAPDPSDPSIKAYPNGAKNPDGTPIKLFTREIYTDPYGNTWKPDSADTGNPIVLPQPATQFPTQLNVWGGSRVDAVQLTYPAGGGPGGVTQTLRMGDQNGGTNQPSHGGTFSISPDNLIIQVYVTYNYGEAQPLDQVVNTMQLRYNDGTLTNQMGGESGSMKSGWVGYLYQAVSSIYIHGVNPTYKNSADCIVFGFMHWNPPAATLRGLRSVYVKSPKEHSAADFARAYPKLGITGALITDKLKTARKAYWASLEARAKLLK